MSSYYDDDKLPYTIDVSFDDGTCRETIARLADRAGAEAAYAALIDQNASNRWLTLSKHGQRIKRGQCSGKWHEEFRARTMGIQRRD